MDYKSIINGCPAELRDCIKPPLFSLDGVETAAKIFQQYDLDSAYMAIMLHGQLTSFKIRMSHIDSPELRSKDPIEKKLAYEARDCARNLIENKVCLVKCFGFDKYGRVLVEITTADGVLFHEWALEQKLAYPYEGKTKQTNWADLRVARDALLSERKI